MQRGKNGCWTCRLRRKKCDEGGPPCSSCQSRGIFCHGYGPKPAWKDRGEKERGEALRLHLQSRKRRNHSLASSSDASQQPTTSESTALHEMTPMPDLFTPLQTEFSFSLSPSHAESDSEFPDALDFTSESAAAAIRTTLDEPWTNSSSVGALVEWSHFQPQIPILEPAQAFCFGGQGPKISEKEIELVMNFITDTYVTQYVAHGPSSTMQKSCLLFLLTRSSTFYYTSLSMSAYHCVKLASDGAAHGVVLQDYHEYRKTALSSFASLSIAVPSPAASLCSLTAERLICGVQIALLEVLGPAPPFSPQAHGRTTKKHCLGFR